MILQFHSLKSLADSKQKLWKYPGLLWWVWAALGWRWRDRSRVQCQILVLPFPVPCLEGEHGAIQPETLNLSARTCEAAVILVGVRAFLTTSVATPGQLRDSIKEFWGGNSADRKNSLELWMPKAVKKQTHYFSCKNSRFVQSISKLFWDLH